MKYQWLDDQLTYKKKTTTEKVLLNFGLPGVLLHADEEIGARFKLLVAKSANVINTHFIICRSKVF